jgi:cell division protein FtsB
MKPLVILLIILLLVLQYKLWFSDGGFLASRFLAKKITAQQAKNADMQKQNAILMADVKALKHNDGAIEARARNDLGMIKKGEVFYQVVR